MEKSKFEFLGFRISKFDIIINDDYLLKEETYLINVDKNIKIDKNDKTFAEISLNIMISSESKNIQINLLIKGAFKSISTMDEELFNRMCEINAPAVLLPYARAYLSSCTVLAGIPPINIPLMNLSRQTNTDK
ncbi:MAG: protein-export chaperone SecB [Candidatus Celaenobacter antarcticus]|nr:protein-export chaperone SecB [Candidatus Celaenobacter antarcticus]